MAKSTSMEFERTENRMEEERLLNRFTETRAQRRERIAHKIVDPQQAAALARLWGARRSA